MPRYAHAPSLAELLSQCDVEDAIMKSASSSPTSVSPFNIKNFEAFLVRSHCDENYEFWKSCNYYLHNADQPTFDFVRWNTEIYENFIQMNAPMECNLPEDIKKAYQDWYLRNIIPSREIVLKARQHALNLMSDAYRQFIRYTNTSTPPPPPSPAATIGVDTNYFAQQRDPRVRKNARDRGQSEKPALKRSLTASNAIKSGASISTSSSSSTSSCTELAEARKTGALGLINKGKALVTKLKCKTRRPNPQTSESTADNLPTYHPILKGTAADRDLDSAR